jgi:hypothetical protein
MEEDLRHLYLNMIKRCLLGLVYEDKPTAIFRETDEQKPDGQEFDLSARTEGYDWPSQAHTMVGLQRMDNIQYCVEQVIKENVPGDFIETGVWRGGSCIFMRAILQAYGVKDRSVWVADSFQGLPPPNPVAYPHDTGLTLNLYPELAVSLEAVQTNFKRYDLLDEQVQFLKGWFRDTLPAAPVKQLAILRLDGDLYESTMDGLIHLYPKLAVGGYVIVDDYGAIEACKQAVHDYRQAQNINDEIHTIDWTGVYWKRSV